MMTFFDIGKAAVFHHAVQMKEDGKLGAKTYSDISNDIAALINKQY